MRLRVNEYRLKAQRPYTLPSPSYLPEATDLHRLRTCTCKDVGLNLRNWEGHSRDRKLINSDYRGATSAGLEARLIRRQGEWSDGAVRTSSEDLEGVRTISSLRDVVEEVRRRNGL
jgi:hypothetical protein